MIDQPPPDDRDPPALCGKTRRHSWNLHFFKALRPSQRPGAFAIMGESHPKYCGESPRMIEQSSQPATIQWIGKPMRRLEDARLLSGQGRFTDDVSLPNQAHAAFTRSPHAHAKIVRIDTA